MAIILHYLNRMRRVWLTILIAFAVAASGVASATAAQDCPMRAAATAHDCCLDNNGADQDHPQQHKMDGCLMGMACRTTPAVTPTLEPVRLTLTMISSSQPIMSDVAKPSGPLEELFRPPRTI
ncbi:MAG TPA: hypothetical protein DHW63_10940 [Hyphomonadaceae bacterium]|nr:hypothetical protein [Hyphomonadaceae bacterium]